MPQPCEADGGVEFRSADLDIELTGLFQSLKMRGSEANHRFAKRDNLGHDSLPKNCIYRGVR